MSTNTNAQRRLARNSLPGLRPRNRATHRGVTLAKSKRAPSLRVRVRPEGVGDSCHRWYETGTGRYLGVDPLSTSYMTEDRVYTYAGSRPLMFQDSLGLKVSFEGEFGGGYESYWDRAKECFPKFRPIAEHFERISTEWTIRDSPFRDGSCLSEPTRRLSKTVVVAPLTPEFGDEGTLCMEAIRCFVHEFAERYFIDEEGLRKSQGGAGPADKKARELEGEIPRDCCSCE